MRILKNFKIHNIALLGRPIKQAAEYCNPTATHANLGAVLTQMTMATDKENN